MDSKEETGAALAPSDATRLMNKVEQFREGVKKSTIDAQVAATSLSVAKREGLYAMLQEAFVIASELMQPENTEVLDKLLKQYGIKKDGRPGTNPWMAVVNLLFVRLAKGKKGKVVVVVDRSAKKYAPVFLCMDKKEVPPEEAADYIMAFDDGNHGRALKGLEKAGRSLNGKEPDEMQGLQRINHMLKFATPLAVFPRDEMTNRPMNDGEFFTLWGRLIGSNVHVYGELYSIKGSNSRVVQYLYKASKEAFDHVKKLVGGTPVGKGNMRPRLIGENILMGVITEGWAKWTEHKRATEAAAKAEDVVSIADAKPKKGKRERKAIKTRDAVGIEGQEVADATA